MFMRIGNDTHWFLKHKTGIIVDPTKCQFGRATPDYTKARGRGFLTKEPSKRARAMMRQLVWQNT